MADEPKPATGEPATPQTGGAAAKAKDSGTDGRASKLWEWVGKAGVVVALLGGAIAIYNYLYPRGPSLTAYCTTALIGEYLKHGYETAFNNLEEAEQEKAKRTDEKKPGKGKSAKNTLRDPHLRDVGLLRTIEHPTEGRIYDIRPPNSLSCGARDDYLPAPKVGQQSREILKELDYDDDVIEAMIEARITVDGSLGAHHKEEA